MSNNKPTFKDFDKFNREPFSRNLTKIITRFFPLYEGSFVLSLNSKYGSGKTTFLKMWKNELEKDHKVVYIDAWKSDFDEEPILNIISSLLDFLHKENSSISKKIIESLITFFGASALTINQLLPIDIDKICQRIEKDNADKDIEKIGKALYQEYSFKKNVYQELDTCLTEYVDKNKNQPLIIMIDELDRVRPDYAVKFLEAIKHFFSVQGICFVIAVDKKQLKASIQQLYGNIDFNGYYMRFVTREVDLPDAIKGDLNKYTNHLLEGYFNEDVGLNFPVKQNDINDLKDFTREVIKKFEFSLRDAEALIRIFVHFVYIEKESTAKNNWMKVSLILIAISLKNKRLYHEIGKDIATPDAIHDFMKSLNFSKNNSAGISLRYFILVIFSFYLLSDDTDRNDEIADICLIYDPPRNLEDAREEIIGFLIRQISDYGDIPYSQSYLSSIYTKLENWDNFFSR